MPRTTTTTTTTLQSLLNEVWSNYGRIQRKRKDEREDALYDLYSSLGTPDYNISVDQFDTFIRKVRMIDEAVDSLNKNEDEDVIEVIKIQKGDWPTFYPFLEDWVDSSTKKAKRMTETYGRCWFHFRMLPTRRNYRDNHDNVYKRIYVNGNDKPKTRDSSLQILFRVLKTAYLKGINIYSAKVAGPATVRKDTVVIYISGRDYDDAANHQKALLKEMAKSKNFPRSLFGNVIPPGTAPVSWSSGVSYADEPLDFAANFSSNSSSYVRDHLLVGPLDAESFGEFYAKLINMVMSARTQPSSKTQFMRFFAHAIGVSGFDPNCPHEIGRMRPGYEEALANVVRNHGAARQNLNNHRRRRRRA